MPKRTSVLWLNLKGLRISLLVPMMKKIENPNRVVIAVREEQVLNAVGKKKSVRFSLTNINLVYISTGHQIRHPKILC